MPHSLNSTSLPCALPRTRVVNVRRCSFPSRNATNGTCLPTGVESSSRLNAGTSSGIRASTAAPSYFTSTSPAFRPATAAGDPGNTPLTSTPRSIPRFFGRACPSMPVQLRSTRPDAISCCATSLAILLGIAPPRPIPISLIPTISPAGLTSGPPLLPGKICASCPIQRTTEPTASFSMRNESAPPKNDGIMSWVLLTMPFVTDCETAAGQPIASTTSPTFNLSESPNCATCNGSLFLRLVRSSWTIAMSVNGSVATKRDSTSSPSHIRQISRLPRPATWWLVMM